MWKITTLYFELPHSKNTSEVERDQQQLTVVGFFSDGFCLEHTLCKDP